MALSNYRPPVREVDVELVDGKTGASFKRTGNPDDPVMRFIALIMDNLFQVPGTKIRFGIDPLLGLIPGVGDTTSSLVSVLSMSQAARQGLPKILVARMALNIFVNAIFGAIPGLGDVFSFWFKSNQRNYELLQKHMANPTRVSTRSDWVFVCLLTAALAVAIVTLAVTAAWVAYQMLHFIFGRN